MGDPASPIQTVMKEDSLGYKVDLIDGKVGSQLTRYRGGVGDPASPIQTVMKEGSLGYKLDLIDGKVGTQIKRDVVMVKC